MRPRPSEVFRKGANPRDWRIDQLETVASTFGVRCRKPGGHVIFEHPAVAEALSVPARRPIKPIYVTRFVRLIDAIRGVVRLLPDSSRDHEPGSVGPPKITLTYLWRQWGNGHNRFKELRRRGVSKFRAAVAAGSPTGFWRMSGHPAVQTALRNHHFDSLGLPRLYVPEPA